MPRIQVLHLPAPADEYPFVLVIDECKDAGELGFIDAIAEKTGAKAVIVFEQTVEVL